MTMVHAPVGAAPAAPGDGVADDSSHAHAAEAAVVADPQLAALVRRLRRVEGQVGGLIRMLEGGRDCTDVITQLAAASRALDRVGFLMVASELRKCATGEAVTGDEETAAARAAALEKLFLTLA